MGKKNYSWLNNCNNFGKIFGDNVYDQHEMGWCGSCYVISAIQCLQDRLNIFQQTEKENDEHIILNKKIILDNFSSVASQPGWNACHGGSALDVIECISNKKCSLIRETSNRNKWPGFVSKSTWKISNVVLRKCVAYRVSYREVMEEVMENGPVILEINARLLKTVCENGKVRDEKLREPNHSVCVTGWKNMDGEDCWEIRNTWGMKRVPKDIPSDISCVSEGTNVCRVEWEEWRGDPRRPGVCYIPMSNVNLHVGKPWIVILVET
jgi:hypothetical protein